MILGGHESSADIQLARGVSFGVEADIDCKLLREDAPMLRELRFAKRFGYCQLRWPAGLVGFRTTAAASSTCERSSSSRCAFGG